jgi:hypothetical protein
MEHEGESENEIGQETPQNEVGAVDNTAAEQTEIPLEGGEESEVSADDYEPQPGESASDTARNIANLLKAKEDSGNESEGRQEQTKEASNQERQTVRGDRVRDPATGKFVKQELQSGGEDLNPPGRLTPEQKKLYMSLPNDEMKRAVHKMFKDHEGAFTVTQKRFNDAITRADGVLRTANEYIRDNNLTDEKGNPYSPDRLFHELVRAHHNVMTNPDYYLANMIKDTNANVENINKYLQGETPDSAGLTKHPTFVAMQNQINQLNNVIGQMQTFSREAQIAPLSKQFEEVMDEIDPITGEYKYPLFQNPEFIERTKPIVVALKGADGSLSHKEALKKAYAVLTNGTYSPGAQKPIVPARQDNTFRTRQRNAAISVRGKVSPLRTEIQSGEMGLDEIPASATETARLILRRLQGA